MTWGKKRAIVVTALILFFVLIVVWAVYQPTRLTGKSVLVIDASGEIEDQSPIDALTAIAGRPSLVLQNYLDAIDSAGADSHISGLVVRIGPLDTGWAKIEELRSHLLSFRRSGKPSICYLGYDGIGNPEYYLATACREVWLVPSAPIDIKGMMAEALFLRGTLDKLKIVPQFYHIAEYKTAYNEFTEKGFTPPHREEVESILQGVYQQYLTDSAQARRMDRAKFQTLVEQGPLSGSQAVSNGLVDRLAYWDQVQDYFEAHAGGWNPVSLSRYRTTLRDGIGGADIAVVYATGDIVSGDSGTSVSGGLEMGGDSVASDIRRVRENPRVRAIVLRVDSGGGSVVASEVIRREVELARMRKPVVVSMSDLAASGGYWISAPATKIVAEPDTETGSIGVLVGKLNLAGLYNLLGMSTDRVATSDNATLFSDQQNFTPAQEAYIQKTLQETYADFTRGVASGRHMSVEAVDKIAKGRVWTGEQAKALGLVDDLGGLDRAIEVAKQLAHIPASQSVRILRLPREKTLWEELLDREQQFDQSRSRSLDSTLKSLVGVTEPIQARMPGVLRIR